MTLHAKSELIAIFTTELSPLEDWHYSENADTTNLYYNNAAIIRFIRGNQVSRMSHALSSLDAFLRTKMDVKSDLSNDYIQSSAGKNTEVI